jgi:lysophospholipase L1-like esterase
VERGIPADVLPGFLARLNYVYELHPRIVCIMGGINDVYNWTPVEEIYKNYIKIIEALRAKQITVVVQSTLCVAKRYQSSQDRNGEVEKLDKLLFSYCKSHGLEYLDLNSKLSRSGFLKDEVTHDGLHLNATGYKIWADELEAVLRRVH